MENIPPQVFDRIHQATRFWSGIVGIIAIEKRELICRYNSTLSFYIFHEDTGKHSREHFHAIINGEKVASIYLDTLEIDYLNSKIKKSDEQKIKNWVNDKHEELRRICVGKDGRFDIPFNEHR